MAAEDESVMRLIDAIVRDDRATARRLLRTSAELAKTSLVQGATRQEAKSFWLDDIEHYLNQGDTALHIAGASYRAELAAELIRHGAHVDARNRRGASPLHYATDGVPGSRTWNPQAQRDTIECLLDAGADPNAVDKNGTTPLHRAVRNRCADAVAALLEGGADSRATNGRGSTPAQLAEWTTGRGGTGSPEARAQQDEIVRVLSASGASERRDA